jgi:hypothetical protein
VAGVRTLDEILREEIQRERAEERGATLKMIYGVLEAGMPGEQRHEWPDERTPGIEWCLDRLQEMSKP